MIHIGIDMHGTLITDRKERIPSGLVGPLVAALDAVRSKRVAKVYLCTGNDLGFVKRKIAPEVLARLHGHVLEIGCVLSDGATETPVVPGEVIGMMRDLEREIAKRNFPEVYKFAKRRVIVSIFTVHGTPPEALLPKVQSVIEEQDLSGRVRAVCSSVAVDVTPRGFSKLTGMRHVAGTERVMGIADSMNDVELVLGADLAAVPANVKPELLAEIERTHASQVFQSEKDATEAVIETLIKVADGWANS